MSDQSEKPLFEDFFDDEDRDENYYINNYRTQTQKLVKKQKREAQKTSRKKFDEDNE